MVRTMNRRDLGKLGTFALLKLPTLRWGTLFIKIKFYLLEVLNRVLTELCLFMEKMYNHCYNAR